jgi:hypothetical protein
MASQLPDTLHACLRRLLPAALLAAAVTLGGSAVGDPTIACAEPNTGGGEWDIGKYDNCIAGQKWMEGNPLYKEDVIEGKRRCCVGSGGEWNAAQQKCQAPAAKPADAQPPHPGVAPPPVGATQNPAPPPPPFRNPGVVIETFTPAPASPG